jgi:hypothetical protein
VKDEKFSNIMNDKGVTVSASSSLGDPIHVAQRVVEATDTPWIAKLGI